ncbi:MAG: hypothetical protein R2879_21300 [Saprospiraceae bacterium]
MIVCFFLINVLTAIFICTPGSRCWCLAGDGNHIGFFKILLFLNEIFSITFNALAIDTSITHIRPRFKLLVNYSPEEMLARLDAMLKTKHPGLKGKLVDNHIILDIIGPEVHYWSPHLNFRVEPDENNPENSYVMGISVLAQLSGPCLCSSTSR